MLDRIKSLCKEKNITVQQLEKEAGLSNGSIGKWDKFAPRASNLHQVCEVLGVTMEYLLTGKQPTVTDGLSEEAIMIANIIDALPPERRRLLLALVRELASAPADPASSSESP